LSEQRVLEEIKEMARLTMLSNKLNAIQEKNLQAYPYVFFEGVKKGTIVYDLECGLDTPAMERQAKTHVTYTIEIDTDTVITFQQKRIDALKIAVRTLFWSDLTVNVEIVGGKNG